MTNRSLFLAFYNGIKLDPLVSTQHIAYKYSFLPDIKIQILVIFGETMDFLADSRSRIHGRVEIGNNLPTRRLD
jgi:hypothetical protein